MKEGLDCMDEKAMEFDCEPTCFHMIPLQLVIPKVPPPTESSTMAISFFPNCQFHRVSSKPRNSMMSPAENSTTRGLLVYEKQTGLPAGI